MYKVTTDVLEKRTPKFIGAGIHEVKMTEVKVAISANNKPYLAFYYENKEGQILSKTEWGINFPSNFNTLSEEDKKKYQAIAAIQMKRIFKIAGLFIDKKIFENKEYANFEALANHVKAELEGKFLNVPLRIKCAFDKNGWVTTPSYTDDDNEWIERADLVSVENSKIRITSKDVMERPTPKVDIRTRKVNPLVGLDETGVETTSESEDNEDLPF